MIRAVWAPRQHSELQHLTCQPQGFPTALLTSAGFHLWSPNMKNHYLILLGLCNLVKSLPEWCIIGFTSSQSELNVLWGDTCRAAALLWKEPPLTTAHRGIFISNRESLTGGKKKSNGDSQHPIYLHITQTAQLPSPNPAPALRATQLLALHTVHPSSPAHP